MKFDPVVNKVDYVVHQRLAMLKKKFILYNYEGTCLDQLAFYFIRKYIKHKVRIICSIRPCMDVALQIEVFAFAREHNLLFIGFEKDCRFETKTSSFQYCACANVTEFIFHFLKNTGGYLLSSALLTDHSSKSFQEIDEKKLFEFNSEHVIVHTRKSDINWSSIYLFAGLSQFDIACSYLSIMKGNFLKWRIPLCYLDCYNENELRKLIAAFVDLLKTYSDKGGTCYGREQSSIVGSQWEKSQCLF